VGARGEAPRLRAAQLARRGLPAASRGRVSAGARLIGGVDVHQGFAPLRAGRRNAGARRRRRRAPGAEASCTQGRLDEV